MRSVNSGRFPHANIFLGARGSGRRAAADCVSRALNCSAPNKPCGKCPSCKKFAHGAAADYISVAPDADKSYISVKNIRDVVERVAVRPFDGGYYAVIIDPADSMRPEAQNALLKTLEEPPERVAFFLITEDIKSLLPTIASRCAITRFQPMETGDCEEYLISRGVEPSLAQTLSRAAGGAAGRALELAGDASYSRAAQRITSQLNALSGVSDAPGAAYLIVSEKIEISDALDIIEGWARDKMTRDIYNTGGGADGARLMRAAARARMRIEANVSKPYAIESMFLEALK